MFLSLSLDSMRSSSSMSYTLTFGVKSLSVYVAYISVDVVLRIPLRASWTVAVVSLCGRNLTKEVFAANIVVDSISTQNFVHILLYEVELVVS